MLLAAGIALLAFAPSLSAGVRCTTQHYGVFRETTVASAINKCKSASEVPFPMPPTKLLSMAEREQICDERECKDMIAAVDDMEVPRCELLFNGKNETLQMTLDRFTAICDAPRTVPPMKKKRMGVDETSTAYTARGYVVAVLVAALATVATAM